MRNANVLRIQVAAKDCFCDTVLRRRCSGRVDIVAVQEMLISCPCARRLKKIEENMKKMPKMVAEHREVRSTVQ
jgi:hypothetical protein